MAEHAPDTTVHRIDAGWIICYVDEAFRKFAVAAGVPDLPDRALGTPILDHITGDTTKEWYRSLFLHIIRHGSASFDCRCDTPIIQRQQRMFARRLANQGIEMQTMTLWTAPCPRGDGLRSLDPSESRERADVQPLSSGPYGHRVARGR